MALYRDHPPPTDFAYAVFIDVGHIESGDEVFVPLSPTKMSLAQLRGFMNDKLPSEGQMRYILSALTRPDFRPSLSLARFQGQHRVGEKAECVVGDVCVDQPDIHSFRTTVNREFGWDRSIT